MGLGRPIAMPLVQHFEHIQVTHTQKIDVDPKSSRSHICFYHCSNELNARLNQHLTLRTETSFWPVLSLPQLFSWTILSLFLIFFNSKKIVMRSLWEATSCHGEALGGKQETMVLFWLSYFFTVYFGNIDFLLYKSHYPSHM